MKTRPKDIGTTAETAITRTAHTHGFPHAHRLALAGNKDQGDIQLDRNIIIEAKAGHTAETASDTLITTWLQQTRIETTNHPTATIGFLVTKRPGHGPKNAHNWWAHFTHQTWANLIGYQLPANADPTTTIRTTLGSALALLKAKGYGADTSKDVRADVRAQEVIK